MTGLFRIVDANVNRASEGLRVLEDLARFYYSNKVITGELKKLRHDIRKNIADYLPHLMTRRDSLKDVGLTISKELGIDQKASPAELAAANFKRLQEALRVIEENLKVLGEYKMSRLYEQYRFNSYALEKDFFKAHFSLTKRQRLDTDLYCLTAEEYSQGRSNIEVVKEIIDSGVRIIQYREKDKKLREKYEECLKIRELTAKAGVALIVNDHVDIALMVKADGVHIGQDDLPPEKVRELVGDEMIIGVSTHSPEQAQQAVKSGADYIGVGPIYKTFTKKDVCEPVGLTYLEYAVKNIDIPFVAIGGIKEYNVHEVTSRGAKCVALVTEIVGAEDIKKKIKAIRERAKIYNADEYGEDY